MHPTIRQHGPGICPICGMALEPLQIAAEANSSQELANMTRRFWIGLGVTVPVFILEMGSHIPGLGLQGLVPMDVGACLGWWTQSASPKHLSADPLRQGLVTLAPGEANSQTGKLAALASGKVTAVLQLTIAGQPVTFRFGEG